MTTDQRTMKECPYCREEVDARAVKCKHCGSAQPRERSAGAEGAGWEKWKIAYVGDETWRIGEPGVQGTPPGDVQEIVSRLSEPGQGGGLDFGEFCVATEVCEPGEIVFGPITIPILKCKWVVICSGPMPM
jgi:hypothetical protein